ncbi:MAG: succinylglutamate desuccinylase/aspartoacylase family protein [Pseudomonadota bacterium]|nr:succinylglutamate desuccinylase/aspartoacylase family protein [Pseudomonadota bacterium]
MSERLEEICSIELPTGEAVGVHRRRFTGGAGPHVAVVAGVRGDTPEGTRVAHAVGRHLSAHHERLSGTVDIYPCVNPLAAHHGARHWPAFDLDLNRRFPGRADGHAPDRVARALTDAVRSADQVIELRGAHPAFREETQAHIRHDQPIALERALRANVRVVWRRSADLEGTGTLAGEVPGLICLEGGVGNRLTDGVGLELCDGVLNLLVVLGVLPEDALPFHWAAIQRPLVATDADVVRVRATRGGLFLPAGRMWAEVEAGAPLGEVVDPIAGETREIVTAPIAGRVLALREQPVVYPGSLVARLVAS